MSFNNVWVICLTDTSTSILVYICFFVCLFTFLQNVGEYSIKTQRGKEKNGSMRICREMGEVVEKKKQWEPD